MRAILESSCSKDRHKMSVGRVDCAPNGPGGNLGENKSTAQLEVKKKNAALT